MDNLNGLWTIIYSSGTNFDGGVVVFRDGTLLGGDNLFFYVGSYSTSASTLTAQISCIAFTKVTTTIFGVPADRFMLNVNGNIQEGTITATGNVPNAPGLNVSLRITKRSELQ